MRRRTSKPFMPGSITSSTTRRCSPVTAASSPRFPSCAHSTRKPSGARYSPTKGAEFYVVVDDQNAVHSDHFSSTKDGVRVWERRIYKTLLRLTDFLRPLDRGWGSNK